MEFEIAARKKTQLEVVVERAKGWKFPLARETSYCNGVGKVKGFIVGRCAGVKDDYHFLKEQMCQPFPKRIYAVLE